MQCAALCGPNLVSAHREEGGAEVVEPAGHIRREQLARGGDAQGWQRRGDAEARGADFDASDGGARRRFEVGGVDFDLLSLY